MALQVPWDEYEAAILLETWLQVAAGVPEAQMINLVSYKLRLKAVNQCLEIDDIFCNTNGIMFQWYRMADTYKKADKKKQASELFA